MRLAFDPDSHTYVDLDRNETLPSVSSMLERCGLKGNYDELPERVRRRIRERGKQVHQLTADYDHGAITLDALAGNWEYKPWLLAHVKAVQELRPSWLSIEMPIASEQYRYGVRPDRVAHIDKATSVVEIKSGSEEDWHGVQTALQCIALSPMLLLPPHLIRRYGWYLSKEGRCRVIEFVDRADFDQAFEVIARCCGTVR